MKKLCLLRFAGLLPLTALAAAQVFNTTWERERGRGIYRLVCEDDHKLESVCIR